MFRRTAVALATAAALCGPPARAETVDCLSHEKMIKVSSDLWLKGSSKSTACEVTHPISQTVVVELLPPATPMEIVDVHIQIDGVACDSAKEQLEIKWKNPGASETRSVQCDVRPGKWTLQVSYVEKRGAETKMATASMAVKAPGTVSISPKVDGSFELDKALSAKVDDGDVSYFSDGDWKAVIPVQRTEKVTLNFQTEPPKGALLRIGSGFDVWGVYGEKQSAPTTTKFEDWCLTEVVRSTPDATFTADTFDKAAVGWGSLGGPAVSGPSRTDNRALRRLPYLACIEPRADGSALFRLFDPAAPTRGPRPAPSPILPWLEPDRFLDVRLNPTANVKDLKLTPGGTVTDGSGPTDLAGPENLVGSAATSSSSATVMARVAPRTPGAWHLDASWKTSTPSGDVSHSQRLELITLKSFQGAIRVGIGFSAVANLIHPLKSISDPLILRHQATCC